MMEYRQLGATGLKVSALSLGTMTFGGVGDFAKVGALDAAVASRMIDICLDAGVNLVDCADAYSGGAAEEILAEALSGRRERVLIATKAFFPTGVGPNDRGLSRQHLIAACEASLRRLETDYIDLYQVHLWDGITPVEETLDALDTLVRQGKVRYLGCSNFSGWHLMKSLAAAERLGLNRYVSMQIHYTLQAREAEYELVPIALDQGVGILIWGSLAGGLLTGKYRRDRAPQEGRQRNDWGEPPVRDEEQLYAIVDALIEIADAHAAVPAQVGLAWLLGRPAISSLIVGARTESQLRSNLEAVELRLTREEREWLDRLSAPPLLYPYWTQAVDGADRLGVADLSLLGSQIGQRPPTWQPSDLGSSPEGGIAPARPGKFGSRSDVGP